jgi:hypothetical protein
MIANIFSPEMGVKMFAIMETATCQRAITCRDWNVCEGNARVW